MVDQVKFLQNLVRAKGLSGKEEPAANLIENEMKTLGYDEVRTDRFGNVIGVIGDRSPKVMLEGHMDTVEEGDLTNWDYPPFSAEIHDGNMYGRGTVDMKGPLSSMIYGAINARDSIREANAGVMVACVVHEETMEGAAIEQLISRSTVPDIVVLGEPSGLNICIGHRGRAVFDVQVKGETAHASMPHLGKNAVLDLIDVIEVLRNKELGTDPALGDETLALIDVSCKPGDGPIIPDQATARLDFRIGRNTTEEDLTKWIQKAIDEVSGVKGKAELMEKILRCYTGEELSARFFFPAWYLADEKIVDRMKTSLSFISGVEVTTWEFSTDGVYTAGRADIPSVGFGPGEESLAHQPNEHLSLEELELATRGYENIIKTFLAA